MRAEYLRPSQQRGMTSDIGQIEIMVEDIEKNYGRQKILF